MIHVAFVNENTLGHGSYLPPFVRTLEARPELGIVPHAIDVAPLPPRLERWTRTVPLLRRWGADFNIARWRRLASRHARIQLEALRDRQRIDAVVVNTQSVGLDLLDTAAELPLFVCLDATFRQLSREAWFASNAVARGLLPVTLAPVTGRERELFARAHRLLPWSKPVATSLVEEYGIPEGRIELLPPSLALPLPVARERNPPLPRLLFVGGDFRRKGGEMLLEVFRERLAGRCELHVLTGTRGLQPMSGVHVHHDVRAHTPEWLAHWRGADLFVFPSAMETFGIVLLEALAFEVPVVAAQVGAARDILRGGEAGLLLPRLDAEALGAAIEEVLEDPVAARARAQVGREIVASRYELETNTQRMAGWIRSACSPPEGVAAR
jgi:glycosyltransferase involved in cell wall biosynthesis